MVKLSENKLNSIIYAVFMIFFFLLSYVLITTGFDTKTKISVNYQDNSTTSYRLKLLENDIYPNNISPTNTYLSTVVDNIIISFNYQNRFSEIVSGYYKYHVTADLIIYNQSINNPIIKKDYLIKEETYRLLDQGNVKTFSLNDHFVVNYKEYYQTYQDILNKYKIDAFADLIIKVNFYEYLGFSSLEDDYPYEPNIILSIPLSDTIFKLNINEINNSSSFSKFSQKEDVNYFLIIIGLIILSLAITFLIQVIRIIKNIYRRELQYQTNLKDILKDYDDIIIKTKSHHLYKEYNLIYVESFKELLEVYNKINQLIIYEETKKHQEGHFIIISKENAWIYKLKNK